MRRRPGHHPTPKPILSFPPARSVPAVTSLAERSGCGLQTSATGESAPSIIRSIVRTKGVGGLYSGELSSTSARLPVSL